MPCLVLSIGVILRERVRAMEMGGGGGVRGTMSVSREVGSWVLELVRYQLRLGS